MWTDRGHGVRGRGRYHSMRESSLKGRGEVEQVTSVVLGTKWNRERNFSQ